MNKEERGRKASIDGFAHEHIVAGILMKKYQNVSLVDLPFSPYDIIIVRKKNGKEDIIRVQVKTAKRSVSFTGGSRGGADRVYKSGIKTYIQNTETSDVIVGIRPGKDTNRYDLYFIPTVLIAHWGTKSKSIKKLEPLKNNYYFLEHCKDHTNIIRKAEALGLL